MKYSMVPTKNLFARKTTECLLHVLLSCTFTVLPVNSRYEGRHRKCAKILGIQRWQNLIFSQNPRYKVFMNSDDMMKGLGHKEDSVKPKQ